jgi:hypothetical protein
MNYFGASIYGKKPSGIATYSAGPWGGSRCGVALRAFLSELGCLPVSVRERTLLALMTAVFCGASEGGGGDRLRIPNGCCHLE